jgi:hypothetical protein
MIFEIIMSISFIYTFHEYVISWALSAVYLCSSFNARYICNYDYEYLTYNDKNVAIAGEKRVLIDHGVKSRIKLAEVFV